MIIIVNMLSNLNNIFFSKPSENAALFKVKSYNSCGNIFANLQSTYNDFYDILDDSKNTDIDFFNIDKNFPSSTYHRSQTSCSNLHSKDIIDLTKTTLSYLFKDSPDFLDLCLTNIKNYMTDDFLDAKCTFIQKKENKVVISNIEICTDYDHGDYTFSSNVIGFTYHK